MKGKRHTTEEKIRILREADGGTPIDALARTPLIEIEFTAEDRRTYTR